MISEERWEMLSKEQITMKSTGEKNVITKDEEIRGLEGLIECMKHFDELTDEELKKLYEERLQEIEKKYNK